jgi:hypothetical protein
MPMGPAADLTSKMAGTRYLPASTVSRETFLFPRKGERRAEGARGPTAAAPFPGTAVPEYGRAESPWVARGATVPPFRGKRDDDQDFMRGAASGRAWPGL